MHLTFNITHPNRLTPDRKASPGPASHLASAALLTAVTDDQQFKEVIVVPGHAGRRCLKPPSLRCNLTPNAWPGTRLTSPPDNSGENHPVDPKSSGFLVGVRLCQRSSVTRSQPETALPPVLRPARPLTNQSASGAATDQSERVQCCCWPIRARPGLQSTIQSTVQCNSVREPAIQTDERIQCWV